MPRKPRALEELRRALTPRHDPQNALAAIKAAQRKPQPLPADELERLLAARRSGAFGGAPGAVLKQAPSGRVIGFAAKGQRAGRPSKQPPLAAEIAAAEEKFLRDALAVEQRTRREFGLADPAKRRAGAASAHRRGSLAEQIATAAERMQQAGRNPRTIAALIGTKLGVSASYVRKILTKKKKRD